eukprot:130469-Pyramimonas_sp.AAC.1
MEAKGGHRLSFETIRKRVRKMKMRLPRFKRLSGLAKIGRAVAQPCIAPAMQYGIQIVGATKTLIKSMVSMVRVGWR